MNSPPRQILCSLVANFGTSLWRNDERIIALLNDYCRGEYRLERNVLSIALREGIPDKIFNREAGTPDAAVIKSLSDKLKENYSLEQEAACWAVESWERALQKYLPDHTNIDAVGKKTAALNAVSTTPPVDSTVECKPSFQLQYEPASLSIEILQSVPIF